MIRPSSVNRYTGIVSAKALASEAQAHLSLAFPVTPRMPYRFGLHVRVPRARSILRSTALVLSGCSLAACGVLGPHYKRPDIPPPDAWREGPAAQTAAAWPSSDWWHGFNS